MGVHQEDDDLRVALDLHHKAMELADQVFCAHLQKGKVRTEALLREAFESEREAARLVAERYDLEPTRSVLHRSAASLALECGAVQEAQQLVKTALAGNPPEEIASELRELSVEEWEKRLRLDIARLCQSMGVDASSVDDIVQETLSVAFGAESFRSAPEPLAWLKLTARRIVLRMRAAAAKSPVVSHAVGVGAWVRSGGRLPDQELYSKELAALLQKVLQEDLGKVDREILRARLSECMKYADVRRLLEASFQVSLSLGAVRLRFHRAVKRIRDTLLKKYRDVFLGPR